MAWRGKGKVDRGVMPALHRNVGRAAVERALSRFRLWTPRPVRGLLMSMLGHVLSRPQTRRAVATDAMPTSLSMRVGRCGTVLMSAIVGELLALELLDQHVTPPTTEVVQQQCKMDGPHKGAEDDGPNLQIANGIEHGLALASKDVEHVAHEDARLCAHRRAPDAEEGAVARQEQSGNKAEQDQDRDGDVHEDGATRQRALLHARVPEAPDSRVDEDGCMVEKCEDQGS